MTGRITVAAHRGYSTQFPENTLLAFTEAIKLGVDMLEFDLRCTKDDAIVVIHDATVDRTTNGTGNICDFTRADIQSLDAGAWKHPDYAGCTIPTLQELIALVQNTQLTFNVEFKEDSLRTADMAIQLLGEAELLDRCVFTSFYASVVHHVAQVHGLRCQGFPGDMMKGFVEGPQGTYAHLYAMGIPMARAVEWVPKAKALGLQPWPYCPDTKEAAQLALVAGSVLVTCNDPVPALALYTEKGLR